ncbi:MAG: FapA family protein [Desulfovibrio sp.]|jgi:uncharacterized protein (DUF342 family)|nr:FapA family protein [Desulfovibrio sp.]
MYYLHHYFDPDFRHTQLSPVWEPDGSISSRYLGYVQNVVRGQVLAELTDLKFVSENARDPRFIYHERRLPIGPNCAAHESNPDKIVAAANGYVFYNNGLISVKRLLNIRNDLGFHTGNVFFVGDVAVHGDVQTGFALHAANVLVKGHIESSKVKGVGDVVCLKGIRGNAALASDEEKQEEQQKEEPLIPSTLVQAGGNLRLPFCEHVQLRAHGNIIIDGSCLHSMVYVGGNLVVKGRLQGGTVFANKLIYVESRLGSDYSVPTRVMMGYDAFDYLQLQKIETRIAYLKDRKAFFESMGSRNQVMEQEYAERLKLVKFELRALSQRHKILWNRFEQDGLRASECRLVVPGRVMPGCEIYIGAGYLQTHDTDSDVTFYLEDDEVKMRSNKNR